MTQPEEVKVDVVRDRSCCRRCHYELDGQVVLVREDLPMAMCRCPECGWVQPVGSSWWWSGRAKKDASCGLFVWVISLTFMTLVIAGSIAGLAQSTGFAAGYPLADWIGQEAPGRGAGRFSRVVDTWWERTGRTRLEASGRGVWDLVDWMVLTDILWAVPMGLLAGVWFQMKFLHASAQGRRVATYLIVIVSIVLLMLYFLMTSVWIEQRDSSAADLAMMEVGFYITGAAWALISAVVIAGLWMGRPVLRLLVTHLGGPRQRAWAGPLFSETKPQQCPAPEPLAGR